MIGATIFPRGYFLRARKMMTMLKLMQETFYSTVAFMLFHFTH